MRSEISRFSFPTAVLCGPAALQQLASHLRQTNCQRPLVVTDQGLLQTKAFGLLNRALGENGRRNATTPATGGESGRSCVNTTEGAHRCGCIWHPNVRAGLGLRNPVFALSWQPKLPGGTGMGALTHWTGSFT